MEDTNYTTSAVLSTTTSVANITQCIVDGNVFTTSMKVIIITISSLSLFGALSIILMSYCRVDENNTCCYKPFDFSALFGKKDKSNSNFIRANYNVEESQSMKFDRRAYQKQGVVQYPARLVLVCISVADILVAISHIWGVTNNYVNLQYTSMSIVYTKANANLTAESTGCAAQAFLAMFGAISSFLWTDVLALIAVTTLKASFWSIEEYDFVTYRAFMFYNLICWGIPLIVVCVLGGRNAMGFEQSFDVGWCYFHSHHYKKSEQVGWMFFSYDLWALASMLWILATFVIFCIIFYIQKRKEKRNAANVAIDERNQDYAWRELLGHDYEQDRQPPSKWKKIKMCCLNPSCSKPVIMITMATLLIVLRFWATLLDFILVNSTGDFHCSLANAVLLAFASIGNSTQGLINLIIIILFTGECCEMICSPCHYKSNML